MVWGAGASPGPLPGQSRVAQGPRCLQHAYAVAPALTMGAVVHQPRHPCATTGAVAATHIMSSRQRPIASCEACYRVLLIPEPGNVAYRLRRRSGSNSRRSKRRASRNQVRAHTIALTPARTRRGFLNCHSLLKPASLFLVPHVAANLPFSRGSTTGLA